MDYKSKYYDIEKHGEKFTKEEFVSILEVLENLPQQTLVRICSEHSINFNDDHESTDHEELVSVLITDLSKEQLINIIKS
jgi:hypothetical protein